VTATDLSTLTLPGWAHPTQSRADAVAGQEIHFSAVSWSGAIEALSLPGRPPAAGSNGVSILTRSDVWGCAKSLGSDPDAVFTLLWHALAWGTGTTMFRIGRRLGSIAADVAAARNSLTQAANLSRTDPGSAYDLLLRPSPGAIKYLGPAFFTKFLYFAGNGRPDHPCLILDAKVAKSLHTNGWTSLHTHGPWPTKTYLRYLGLISRWANEHNVAPDELELTLFKRQTEELGK
jgi:hypothetical protein